MLMYGNSMNIIDTGIVYNLTSMREGLCNLPTLIPPNEIGRFEGKDFDIAYANYILMNDFVFIEFFGIVYALYNNTDVYIVISDDDWSENLVESLFKLIQQRYGYNGAKINSFDDYLFLSNSSNSGEFGSFDFYIRNLDEDKERYSLLTTVLRIRNGENVIKDE